MTRPLAPSLAVLCIAVVALNLVDAFCTLRHVELGAVEMNPLMRGLLAEGPLPFLLGKHALASAGVVGIAALGHHVGARRLLERILLPVYAAIAVYHGLLFLVVRG